MDRAQYGWLLLHANALPMLAMQQVLAEIEGGVAGEAQAPEAASGALHEAQARAALDALADRIEADPELSAMGHFNFAVPELSSDEARRLREQVLAEDAAAEAAMAELEALPDGPLDLDRFLARAYAHPLPDARVEAALAKADLGAIAALVAQLPADLPALTAPQDGASLARWLALFREEGGPCERLMLAVAGTDDGA
jgi:hypothetical protein